MSYKKHTSVPIKREAPHGFKRIYDLVDVFEYQNLGKEGKKFVIIKYASHPLHCTLPQITSSTSSSDQEETADQNTPIEIREFQEGDEEGVAIVRQADHFEISEMVRNAETNWEAVYRYKAKSGFRGVDFVEIQLSSGSDGASPPTKIELIKIQMTID